MKSISRVIIFSVPIVFLLLAVYLPASIVGEDFLINLRMQRFVNSNSKYLVGFLTYEKERFHTLKDMAYRNKLPEITVIGSSRVLQFRDSMFTQSFYNYGYTVSTIGDIEKKIPSILHPGLKLLFIGLDQWMFNPEWTKKNIDDQTHFSYNSIINNTPYENKKLLRQSIEVLMNKKRKYHNSAFLGLNAAEGNGIRNDGSFFYGTIIEKILSNDTSYEDYNFKDTFSRIKVKSRRFEKFTFVDTSSINTLKRIRDFLKTKNIITVYFLPPFANTIYKKLISEFDYAGIMELQQKLEFLNSSSKCFYSFQSFDALNETDSCALDGFHGSERVYAHILMNIANNNPSISKFINRELISKKLSLNSKVFLFND